MLTGQCLCGEITYRVKGEPTRVSYCHCVECRRFTGSAVLIGALVNRNVFEMSGNTMQYRSSLQGIRHFCGNCGSSMFYEFDNYPDRIEILVGTMDNADTVIPTFHGFYSERIGWFDVADTLPRWHTMP